MQDMSYLNFLMLFLCTLKFLTHRKHQEAVSQNKYLTFITSPYNLNFLF